MKLFVLRVYEHMRYYFNAVFIYRQEVYAVSLLFPISVRIRPGSYSQLASSSQAREDPRIIDRTYSLQPLGVVLDGLKPCSRCCVLANPNGLSQVLDKFSAVYILFNLVLRPLRPNSAKSLLNSCSSVLVQHSITKLQKNS